jgi:hypothetical protein
VTVRFDDDDVIGWLVDNEAITEEEAESYTPTQEQIRDYAWELIEQDDGEYGSISVS